MGRRFRTHSDSHSANDTPAAPASAMGGVPDGEDALTDTRCKTLAKMAGLLLATVASVALAPAQAAEVVLSGTISAAAGQKLEGVTVSAKREGSTITTSVYTDQSGNYYFPPLPAGSYRVWAQALGFEAGKGAVELSAARRRNFT